MGFRIIDSFEDIHGFDMQTVECSSCGWSTVIYADQDFPCDCLNCLSKEAEEND